jgi:hypothetical protein
MDGHITRMGDVRNPYKIFVREPKGKRPLGRFTRRRENIGMGPREIG